MTIIAEKLFGRGFTQVDRNFACKPAVLAALTAARVRPTVRWKLTSDAPFDIPRSNIGDRTENAVPAILQEKAATPVLSRREAFAKIEEFKFRFPSATLPNAANLAVSFCAKMAFCNSTIPMPLFLNSLFPLLWWHKTCVMTRHEPS
ncbi:MAG: hypothetical protein P4L91_12195 [Burkholderiaceae bacterium]|nr:hypothetical protein [Burkholderiaceae bacterium]